jgi:hypothetical protein
MQLKTLVTALGGWCALTVAAPALAAPPKVVGNAPSLAPAEVFGPAARITLNRAGTHPRQVFGISVPTRGSTAGERAEQFVRDHAAVLGLVGDVESFEVQSPRLIGPNGPIARTIVRLHQLVDGRRVEGRVLVVTLDAQARAISVTSDLGPVRVPNLALAIDANQAAVIVESRFQVQALSAQAAQVVLADVDGGRVAWKVPTAAIPLVAHFWVWVDAVDGRILRTGPVGPHQGLATIPERMAPEGGRK